MLRPFVIGLLLSSSISLAQAQDYVVPTVTAAQEALVRLGYDIGDIDGKWGPKARAAMNDLRAKNELPPAKDFVGSSLELVHRVSPGTTTLPHPGILVTDPAKRREFLVSHPRLPPQDDFCQGPKGSDGEFIDDLLNEAPVAEVTASADENLGFMTRDQSWFISVDHATMGAHNACVGGDDRYCKAIVTLMSKWADADAMKLGVRRNTFAYEDVAWAANTVLRTLIFAYADARKLVDVDPVENATILDWLKRRIDDFVWVRDTHGPDIAGPMRGDNHAMADAMPAMAFGAMVGDGSMLQTGITRLQVSLSSMRDDGSLPAETRRGANALHYSNFQIGQMISAQVVAEAQGINPAGEEAAAGKTIPKAVDFMLDALEDFDKVTPYAKEEQGSSRPDYKLPFVIPAHFGWLPAYMSLFGKDENMVRLDTTFRFDERACSQASLDEGKMQPQFCKFEGPPTMNKLLSIWEVSDPETTGYSPFCLQALPEDWPPLREDW